MDLELREVIYKSAIDKWGEKSQYEMANEEATELALAVRKYIRKNDADSYMAMVKEIADVEVMIEQIKMMNRNLGIANRIELEKIYKVHRLKERVEKNTFE